MTFKLFAYWTAPAPEDIEAFEAYYRESHLPRAAAVPNLLQLVTLRCDVPAAGQPPEHYRVAEMVFASRQAFEDSARSAAWAEMRRCSKDICERFGVRMTAEFGEVDDPAAVSDTG